MAPPRTRTGLAAADTAVPERVTMLLDPPRPARLRRALGLAALAAVILLPVLSSVETAHLTEGCFEKAQDVAAAAGAGQR